MMADHLSMDEAKVRQKALNIARGMGCICKRNNTWTVGGKFVTDFPGYPDDTLLIGDTPLRVDIEFKSESWKASKASEHERNQREVHRRLIQAGQFVATVQSPAVIIEIIQRLKQWWIDGCPNYDVFPLVFGKCYWHGRDKVSYEEKEGKYDNLCKR